MNVTEFAEQIVFGKTLEDKLLIPGRLTRETNPRACPDVSVLSAPARPPGLQMQRDPGRTLQPPAEDKLENEQARGQLLHFLANHELLATELMALVLLKFPDAPHAFRQGVLVTLQEEQQHTRMYIQRMKECGVEFGSFPLSGQFWRVVAPMPSPIDFVSRLSLTFEQANLDYSLHFATVFRKLGDTRTAELLQKIYEDEIGHVGHGLHWFRQWKNPELSDWEAYQDALEFPMSPERGRGPRVAFNREGRAQAGLTDEFIDAIEVFRQSRGRAPTVRWFDPGAEAELAGEGTGILTEERRTTGSSNNSQTKLRGSSPNSSQSAKAAQLMVQLGKDLELVMVAMAKSDDVILVRRLPSREFRKQLMDRGLRLPEFACYEDRSELANRKLHDFSPWAWTPQNYSVAAPLVESTRHAPEPWCAERCELFRKSWGASHLREWLIESEQANELPDEFVSADCAGIPVNSFDEVEAVLGQLAARGYSTALFKQDLAASGRGQRRLNCAEPLNEQDRAWLRSVLEISSQSVVGIVEPQLERLIDLSFLWHVPRRRQGSEFQAPDFLGWTRPLVTAGRRYAGTRLGNAFADCDPELRRFVLAEQSARMQSIVDWLQPRIARELAARNFTGYFGVDAFICQDASGELKVKPLVELNPRMTMGHIALSLGKRLAPGVNAEFRILTKSEWDYSKCELDNVPFTTSRDGHWKSGIIWLGEPDDNTKLVPVLLIGRDVCALARNNRCEKI